MNIWYQIFTRGWNFSGVKIWYDTGSHLIWNLYCLQISVKVSLGMNELTYMYMTYMYIRMTPLSVSEVIEQKVIPVSYQIFTPLKFHPRVKIWYQIFTPGWEFDYQIFTPLIKISPPHTKCNYCLKRFNKSMATIWEPLKRLLFVKMA